MMNRQLVGFGAAKFAKLQPVASTGCGGPTGHKTVGALIGCQAFLTVTTPTGSAFQTPTQERLASFDKRIKNINTARADHVPADRTAAVAELQRRLPTASVTFDEL